MILMLVACATGSSSDALDYPINFIHDAIKQTAPAPIASISENGRNYTTKAYALPLYYRKKLQKPKEPLQERAVATYSINQITKPYVVNIRVEIEELASKPGQRPAYVICCRNSEMEKELTNNIKVYLAKRYKNPNVIDDFRAF